MIIVNTDLESYISGTYNNKNFSVPFTDEVYKTLKELESKANAAISIEALKPIIEEFEKAIDIDFKAAVSTGVGGIVFVEATRKYHIAINDGYSDVHIPDKISDKILDGFERNLDPTPLVNLCRRFILNPKPTQKRFNMLANYITQDYTDNKERDNLMEEKGLSKEVATKHATYMDMQVTSEGYLKTSKVVEEITMKWALKLGADGKAIKNDDGSFEKHRVPRYEVAAQINEETGEIVETIEHPKYLEMRKFTPAIHSSGDKFFSGEELGYKYEVGKLARLERWDQVSMKDDQAHEKGLHTGGLKYVDGYLNKDRELLDVFVCPSQIGKFCNNGLGEMTCKELYVFGSASIEGTTQGLYHTSSYSKIQAVDIQERLEEMHKAHLNEMSWIKAELANVKEQYGKFSVEKGQKKVASIGKW